MHRRRQRLAPTLGLCALADADSDHAGDASTSVLVTEHVVECAFACGCGIPGGGLASSTNGLVVFVLLWLELLILLVLCAAVVGVAACSSNVAASTVGVASAV